MNCPSAVAQRHEIRMIAGRRSKTVAFVVTLALTTFGALAPASPPTFDLPPAFGTPRGLLGPNLVDHSLKTAFAPTPLFGGGSDEKEEAETAAASAKAAA